MRNRRARVLAGLLFIAGILVTGVTPINGGQRTIGQPADEGNGGVFLLPWTGVHSIALPEADWSS